MKGKNLVKLVCCMSDEEFAHVHQSMSLESESEQLVRLLIAIRDAQSLDRKILADATEIKVRQIRRILPKLPDCIFHFLGTFNPDQPVSLELSLHTAWKLVYRNESGPASVLAKQIYDQAESCDRFEIIYELLDLSEKISGGLVIDGLDRVEITQKHLNLLAFRKLKEKARDLKLLPHSEKVARLLELKENELLKSQKKAVSASAKAIFYWIWTRIHFFDENYKASLESQLQLVRLIEQFSWLHRNNQFPSLEENRLLISLLIADGRNEEAYQLLFKMGNTSSGHVLTDLGKWEYIYPIKLGIAIDTGDEEKGISCIEEIRKILPRNGGNFRKQFVTETLYYASYFYFTIGDFEEAQRLNFRLQTAYKSVDFSPLVFPMVRMMSTILALETRDLAECERQDKNFRNTAAFDDSQYFRTSLGIVKRLADDCINGLDQNLINEGYAEFQKTLADPKSKSINRRFNFEAWLESKIQGCTMSKIFRDRESHSNPDYGREAV
jgi:hypothetical protein